MPFVIKRGWKINEERWEIVQPSWMLVGGLEDDFYFSIQLGISQSQLTHIFQRVRPTTNQDLTWRVIYYFSISNTTQRVGNRASGFWKKKSSGAVAPYTFLDPCYLKFCQAKFSDFEGMTRYLQGFVLLAGCSLFTSALDVSVHQAFAYSVAGETEEVCPISMVLSPLPNSNFLKKLRVHSTTFTCAPRTWYYTFGNFPHSIDTTGVHKQGTPFLSLLDARDALTMYASHRNVIIPPHPTPNHWRSSSVASRVYASHMNVIIPPHPTLT